MWQQPRGSAAAVVATAWIVIGQDWSWQSSGSLGFRRECTRNCGQLHPQHIPDSQCGGSSVEFCSLKRAHWIGVCQEQKHTRVGQTLGRASETRDFLCLLEEENSGKALTPSRHVWHTELGSKGKCVCLGLHKDIFPRSLNSSLTPLDPFHFFNAHSII